MASREYLRAHLGEPLLQQRVTAAGILHKAPNVQLLERRGDPARNGTLKVRPAAICRARTDTHRATSTRVSMRTMCHGESVLLVRPMRRTVVGRTVARGRQKAQAPNPRFLVCVQRREALQRSLEQIILLWRPPSRIVLLVEATARNVRGTNGAAVGRLWQGAQTERWTKKRSRQLLAGLIASLLGAKSR